MENQDKLNQRYSGEEVRGCKSKKRFRSREAAILEHIEKHKKGLITHFLKPYFCSFCSHWHNTKDEDRNLLNFKSQQQIRDTFSLADLGELRKEVKKIEKEMRRSIKNKNNS